MKLTVIDTLALEAESITKVSETYRYAVSNSAAIPSSGWETTHPATIPKDCWLHTETTVLWSDGSSTVLYSAERNPNDGDPGQSIVVSSQSVQYSLQSAGNLDPASLTYGSYPTLEKGKWLYSRSTVIYQKSADGTSAGSSVSYSVSYIGTDGDNGTGISSITEHYMASALSTGISTPADGNDWNTNPQPNDWASDKKFLWNYEKIVKIRDGVELPPERTAASVIAIWANGIDSIANYYAVNNSPATAPATGWSRNLTPPTAANPYLWNYEEITYTDETVGTTDPRVIGHYGHNGTVRQRMYCSPSYNSGSWSGNLPAAYTDGSNGWHTSPTAISAIARYRYVTERISNDGGDTFGSWSTPQIEAYLAEDGNSISIRGEAAGVIPWGENAPSAEGYNIGDILLSNSSTGSDYEKCVPDGEGGKEWEGGSSSIGDGYLIEGYLWTKINADASATQLRWKNVGLIRGPKGEDAPYNEYRYALSDSRTEHGDSHISGGWQTQAPTPTSTHPYVWQEIKHFTSDGTNDHTSYICLTGYTGSSGLAGKMCYISGDYDPTVEYKSNANQTVAVEIPAGSTSELYYLVADTNVVEGVHIPPLDGSGQLQSTIWAKGLNDYNLVRTKYLFASFANLGTGFIISGDWAISQYGALYDASGTATKIDTAAKAADTYSDSYRRGVPYMFFYADYPLTNYPGRVNFVPNLAVDGRTGKAYLLSSHIRGELQGVSGTFESLTCQQNADEQLQMGSASGYGYRWYGQAVSVTIDGAQGDLATYGARRYDSADSYGQMVMLKVSTDGVLKQRLRVVPDSIEMTKALGGVAETYARVELIPEGVKLRANGSISNPNILLDTDSRLIQLRQNAASELPDVMLRASDSSVSAAKILSGKTDSSTGIPMPVALPHNLFNASFTLPASPTAGQMIFAKGVTSDLVVTTKSHPIMRQDGRSNFCEANSSCNFNDNSIILAFDGTRWILFAGW